MLTIISFISSLTLLIIVGLDMLIENDYLSVIVTILVLSILGLLIIVPLKFWHNYKENQSQIISQNRGNIHEEIIQI